MFVVLVMGEDEVRRRRMERHGDEDTVRHLMVSVAQPVVSLSSCLFQEVQRLGKDGAIEEENNC